MPRRCHARLILPAAVLPLALACSPGSSDGGESVPSPKPTASVSPTSVVSSASARPSALPPPELDGDETVAARQGETQGSRSFEFAKGRKGDALIVLVRCQGKGTIKVTVRPVNSSFPLDCVDGEVVTTYNQLALRGVEKKGTVSVQAPSGVRWSMTIGRGEPASLDDSGDPVSP